MALAMGIASVSVTMARIRRSSLVASRRSREATSRAFAKSTLRRDGFGNLWPVTNNREVDVLQGRQLTHLAADLQARLAAQLSEVADGKCAPGRHDADRSRQHLGLFHRMRADHQRAPV